MFDKIIDTGFDPHRESLLQEVKHILTDDPKKYRVTIKRYRSNRSKDQNSYYWGVVLKTISDYTGYTSEQIHEICKNKFNLDTIIINEKVFEYGKSTTDLDTLEFSQYIDKIRQWSVDEIGIYVPEANETGFDFLNN